jgi:hypothetical protein
MAKSMTKSVKRVGRPFEGGRDPLLAARFPQPLIDAIDRWAKASSVSRSEAIRRLVEIGLKAKGKR